MSTLLPFALLGSLGVLLLPSLLAEAAGPNILFILADDMGQWAARFVTLVLVCYGCVLCPCGEMHDSLKSHTTYP